MNSLLREVRHAARRLAHARGFTVVAGLTLALGLGANVVIFSVADAVLLQPLPYAQLEQRAMVWSRWRNFEKTWVNPWEMTTYAARCPSIAEATFWETAEVSLTGDGEALRVAAGKVSANTFSVLGTQPALGRAFTAEEDREHGARVVIVSHGLWQGRYSGDPNILGRRVEIDRIPATVVGVMPAGFALPTDYGEDASQPTEIWMPRRPDGEEFMPGNGSHGDYGAIRLKPGSIVRGLNEELKAATAAMAAEGLVRREMQFTAFAVGLQDEIVGAYRPAMLLVTGAVALLMLVACANVANLLLAQAESRQRELAVRSALGASRGRLVTQLLVEGLLLALLGAALSLGVAAAGLRLLSTLGPAQLPRALGASLNTHALAFALGLSLVTTLVFALAPALQATRVELADSLKEGGTRSLGSLGRRRWRGALIAAETALAVLLAVGAGLMARSLQALSRIDLGFEPRGVLTAGLTLPEAAYGEQAQVEVFDRRLLDEVRALPGVKSAGLLRRLPLGQAMGDWGIQVEGYTSDAAGSSADWQVASGGAAETLGERLVAGRLLRDDDAATGAQVAVINQAMARKYWAGRNPLGGRLRIGSPERPWVTVVGVVGDVRHESVTGRVKPKFYRPVWQFHLSRGRPTRDLNLVVKATGDPLALAAPIRAIVRRLDPAVPLANVQSMDDVVSSSVAAPRFTGALLGLFASLALALAAVGVYGVLSYTVSERRQEIGVRVALGADAAEIMRLVVGQAAERVGLGLAAGLGLALGFSRLMGSLLHEVTPSDPATYLMVAAVMAFVALVASALPAFRAAHVDPAVALREE